MEGEVTSGRHEGRREGAVTDRCNSQTLRWSALSLPDNKLYWHCLLSLKFLDKILQEGPQDSSSGTAPRVSTLTSTWCHARDSFSQAFPLRFCLQYAIKNWRWERPGNEASVILCAVYPVSFPDQWQRTGNEASVCIPFVAEVFLMWICWQLCAGWRLVVPTFVLLKDGVQ